MSQNNLDFKGSGIQNVLRNCINQNVFCEAFFGQSSLEATHKLKFLLNGRKPKQWNSKDSAVNDTIYN